MMQEGEEEVALGADDQENLLNAVEELQQENARMTKQLSDVKVFNKVDAIVSDCNMTDKAKAITEI
jgi:hypothetical protein